jgi:hypothetical protein
VAHQPRLGENALERIERNCTRARTELSQLSSRLPLAVLL